MKHWPSIICADTESFRNLAFSPVFAVAEGSDDSSSFFLSLFFFFFFLFFSSFFQAVFCGPQATVLVDVTWQITPFKVLSQSDVGFVVVCWGGGGGGGGGRLLFLALATFKGVSLCFCQTYHLICNGPFSKELAMHCAREILYKTTTKTILFKKFIKKMLL